jgi:acyl carrier protein
MQISQELKLVYSAISRVNDMRLPDEQIPEAPDTVLVGDEGLLDSLAITTLILALEDDIRAAYDQDVPLMQYSEEEDWLTYFRTPQTIAALIAETVK